MKVISVVNQKGGVGKSTIACNLAICAVKDGKNTLVIDSDPQGSSMAFRASREADDLQAVAITQQTIHKDVDKFSNFDIVIVDAGGRDNTLFRSAIAAASKGLLLVPVLPSQYDIWATADTFNVLKETRVYVDIPAYVVLNQIIANTSVSKEAKVALDELVSANDVKLLDTRLYSRVFYKESISDGRGVIEYTKKEEEKAEKAAEEINSLYEEIKRILNI